MVCDHASVDSILLSIVLHARGCVYLCEKTLPRKYDVSVVMIFPPLVLNVDIAIDTQSYSFYCINQIYFSIQAYMKGNIEKLRICRAFSVLYWNQENTKALCRVTERPLFFVFRLSIWFCSYLRYLNTDPKTF